MSLDETTQRLIAAHADENIVKLHALLHEHPNAKIATTKKNLIDIVYWRVDNTIELVFK